MRDVACFQYLRPSEGSPQSNVAYCTKLDSRVLGPWTFGEMRPCGQRTDLEDYIRAVRAGATDLELADAHPSALARYPNVRTLFRSLVRPIRRRPLEVYVLFGPAGCGKSRYVEETYADVLYKLPFARTGLWATPLANMAKVVVLEDFDGGLPLKQLNRLLDPYAEELECKGGHVWWLPDLIFITTNTRVSQWYPGDLRQDVLAQVVRRITAVFDFTPGTGQRMEEALTCDELDVRYPHLLRTPSVRFDVPFQPRSGATQSFAGGPLAVSLRPRSGGAFGGPSLGPDDLYAQYRLARARDYFAQQGPTTHFPGDGAGYEVRAGTVMSPAFFAGGTDLPAPLSGGRGGKVVRAGKAGVRTEPYAGALGDKDLGKAVVRPQSVAGYASLAALNRSLERRLDCWDEMPPSPVRPCVVGNANVVHSLSSDEEASTVDDLDLAAFTSSPVRPVGAASGAGRRLLSPVFDADEDLVLGDAGSPVASSVSSSGDEVLFSAFRDLNV